MASSTDCASTSAQAERPSSGSPVPALPQAGAGLIFSAGDSAGPELDAALEKLRKDFDKPITLRLGLPR
jgi:hypothetical protein